MSVKGKAIQASERGGELTVEAVDKVSSPAASVLEKKARDERGQLGLRTVLAALVVVIAASLAVIVVDQFDQSLGDPDSSALSSSQDSILSGFADMSELIGPLLLVAIAVVIIGLIRRVQNS